MTQRAIRTVLATLALWSVAPTAPASGQGALSPARVWEDSIVLPTYEEGLPDPNPPFDFFSPPRLNYPYTLRTNLTDRRAPRTWRTLNLENEFLSCVILPDLGGHLYRCIDKINGANVFYANPSIKLTQIAYRGAWAALGIEFNFPVSHNWMTTSPVDFATASHDDGSASVWIGNIDRAYGMQWRTELRLHPGRAELEQHTTLYNRSDFRHRFYWWTNAAVQVWDDSRILYPMRYTASHGFRDVDTWPVDARGTDNSVVGNHIFGPVSRFSHGSREPYMAVYHPRTNAGVVHYADIDDLPAKKIWSWGSDANGLRWRKALSDNNSAYAEIQRGLFRDQETYGFLEPQQTIRFSEYWIPIRDIDSVARANRYAVMNMRRDGANGMIVKVNVTRPQEQARIELDAGERLIESIEADMAPDVTWAYVFELLEADQPQTITVRDRHGNALLTHTEAQYDFAAPSEITLGPQPTYEPPALEHRSEGDYLAVGIDQERNGRRLEALRSYRDGLQRFPQSVWLRKAAGRLAVVLKRYAEARVDLEAVLSRVSNDYEAAYYLGHAEAGLHDTVRARSHWEEAQHYGTFRPAALFHLAALDARAGDLQGAATRLGELIDETPHAVRAGGLRVALLRNGVQAPGALAELDRWIAHDPTNAFLRYEATRAKQPDPTLAAHLAADPERILEIVVDYIRFGLWDDALSVLSAEYPMDGSVHAEPGMPHPSQYPLVAYYRAYVRHKMDQDPSADLAIASALSTAYVFPNRVETFAVLGNALDHDSEDATAHFLLGSLFLTGGQSDSALTHWETARQLNPDIPTLHRNMGYALLHSGGSPELAARLFREGIRGDAKNVDLYFGLDDALLRSGRTSSERADALLLYPNDAAMPAQLVYRSARRLAEAHRFDEADALFAHRFFPSEEGGINVRQVYLEVRAARAQELAKVGECAEAGAIVNRLTVPVDSLPFTQDGLGDFLDREVIQHSVATVRDRCPEEV